MADNPVSMLADRIEVTSNTSNITITDVDKAMLLQIFNQRQKTGPPSEDTRPCTHTHTFYPRNLVPVKSSRVIHFVPWKIPTRRGYHDHESKKIVIEDGSVVEFIPYEKPDEEETLSEAIDRVNLFHGRTRWTLHWYSVDDGSERGIEMATIARDTIFRDRGYDKGGVYMLLQTNPFANQSNLPKKQAGQTTPSGNPKKSNTTSPYKAT